MYSRTHLYFAIRIDQPKHPLVRLFTVSLFVFIDVIYLNGLYIEPYFTKGVKGFRIFHDSEYFKEKMLYHKD
jgi:hypothetical protein